jgi:endo-1,4-beta-xylanase
MKIKLAKKFITGMAGIILCAILYTPGCSQAGNTPGNLKDAFSGRFLIGTALNGFQITGKDSLSATLIDRHFNSITPENCTKWQFIHPEPGRYDFTLADRFVELGGEKQMHMVGHVLVWHSQTPRWVFRDEEGNPVSRDTLLARMRDHIHTVVGRYRGKIDCWDVVNEAIGDDGEMRKSPYFNIIGEDYVEKAFAFAREADPEATLIYNDYSLPNPVKRAGVVKMVKQLQSKGIRIDGIGMQGHYHLDYPDPGELAASIEAFSGLGLKVMITEMDVNVLPQPGSYRGADVGTRSEMRKRLDPYIAGLPDSVQDALAERYKLYFEVFCQHSKDIERVTFWGVHDGGSWLNNWPVPGRTNYPLLFDRAGQPKPACDAVIATARSE